MIRGNEIRIKWPSRWEGPNKAQWIVDALDRITRIVSTSQLAATPKTDGYPYSLDDMSNDWWAKFDEEAGELVVAYRYGDPNLPWFSALELVIAKFCGLDR